jgi:hypothetical protein
MGERRSLEDTMASRWTRRKKAALAKEKYAQERVESFIAHNRAEIVRKNLSTDLSEAEKLSHRAWAKVPNCIVLCEARGSRCESGLSSGLDMSNSDHNLAMLKKRVDRRK